MNFCPECGAQLVTTANFCWQCGANLRERKAQLLANQEEPASSELQAENDHPEGLAKTAAQKKVELPEEHSVTNGSEDIQHVVSELDAAKNKLNQIREGEELEKTDLEAPQKPNHVEASLTNATIKDEPIHHVTNQKVASPAITSEYLPMIIQPGMVSQPVKKPMSPVVARTPVPVSSKARVVKKVHRQAPSSAATSDKGVGRQLRVLLNALYIKIADTFDVKMSTENLATKFSRIKLRISKQIQGYDLDELANRVEPLCRENYVATQADIDFVQALIGKYQNYGQSSKLEQKLNLLSGQSRNAIADAEHLNDLQEYMHVNRGNLEQDLLQTIVELDNVHSKLIFLVGNVGDGKSHLIGYLKQQHADLFAEKHIRIHYDATESFDPQKTAMDTLLDVLTPFEDDQIDQTNENLICAINMGILMNFIRAAQNRGNFVRILDFLRQSGIETSTLENAHLEENHFSLLPFRNYPLFEVDQVGTTSEFYDELFEKVITKNDKNPFYAAYLVDKKRYVTRLTHHNFELFMNPQVREALKFLLIKIQIQSKVIISTRALLELIHDILVPASLEENDVITYHSSLPYLLFGGYGDSAVIKKINEFDPQNAQSRAVDELMTRVYNSQRDIQELAEEMLGSSQAQVIGWLWSYLNQERMTFTEKMGLLLRMQYLLHRVSDLFDDHLYQEYLNLLTTLRQATPDKQVIHQLYKKVKDFIYSWNGSPQSNYIFTFINEKEKFGVAIPFNLVYKNVREHEFNIVFTLENADASTPYELVIDYDLFDLIDKVSQGYLLKDSDRHQFVNVATFIENITKSCQAGKETLIGNVETNDFYRLTYDGMDVEMGEMN